MSKPESVLGFPQPHIWRTLTHEICCKRCLGKGRIRARGWQNFGAWWLYNHLWYAIAAKLLSGDKRFKLPMEFETERPNPRRVDLRILSGCFWPSCRVRGKTLQPGQCLWFLFFPPSGRRKSWNISKGELWRNQRYWKFALLFFASRRKRRLISSQGEKKTQTKQNLFHSFLPGCCHCFNCHSLTTPHPTPNTHTSNTSNQPKSFQAAKVNPVSAEFTEESQ